MRLALYLLHIRIVTAVSLMEKGLKDTKSDSRGRGGAKVTAVSLMEKGLKVIVVPLTNAL